MLEYTNTRMEEVMQSHTLLNHSLVSLILVFVYSLIRVFLYSYPPPQCPQTSV